MVSKAHPSTLILVFLTGFRYFSYHVATQLSSQGWIERIPDPTLPEKCLQHGRSQDLVLGGVLV